MTLVSAFYSDSGVVPRTMLALENYEYAFHFHLLLLNGNEWFVYIILATLALLSIFLIVGYKTRLVTFLCWFLVCSLFVRNHLILDSQDTLLILLFFWAIFLPIGSVFSIDAIAKNYDHQNPRVFSAATVGLHIQFVLVYIMNGLYKGQYLAWIDGTHLYNTFSRFEFVKPLAFAIYPYFDLLLLLTKFSLFLELFGPLLLFVPLYFVFFRMTGIALFLGLQISILFTLDIGLFPLVSITGILVLLPSAFWDFVTSKILKRPSIPGATHYGIVNTKKAGANMFTEVFIVIVISYTIIWNVSEYSSKITMPDEFKIPGYYLKLDQKWALFAAPTKKSEYVSVYAHYNDGTTSDLMEDLKAYKFAPNKMRYASYNDYRWRIFITKHVGDSDQIEFMPRFINYLVAEYSPEESKSKKIERVDIIPHMHYIGDNYDLTPVQTDIIYTMNIEE